MSYSQISQDIFVFNIFNKKQTGSFLDLGCGDGVSQPCGNNTYLLELNGWKGLSIDIDSNLIEQFNNKRKSKAIVCDLTKFQLSDVLNENNSPELIDYLSFDIDDATEFVLSSFPFDKYKFNFITFEHNLYHYRYKGLKEKSKNLFLSHGYELLIENVCIQGLGPVEDWYVNPNYNFNKKIFLKDIINFDLLKQYQYI